MWKLKLRIICFFALTYFLSAVVADCTLNLEEEAPLLRKKIGERILTLPVNRNYITMESDDTISAYCPKGNLILKNHNGDNNYYYNNGDLSNVEISCGSNKYISITDLKHPENSKSDFSYQRMNMYCIQHIQIFQSNNSLPNCKDYTSFGIGRVLESTDQLVIAGICYNFKTLTTKYVKYLAYRPQYDVFNDNLLTEENNLSETHITDLDIPVDGLKILFKDKGESEINFKWDLYFQKLSNPLLNAHEFEFLNLVQDTQLAGDVSNFDYLLNTIWWRNFRLGSWKIFLNAFEKRTETIKYIVYTGTSGNTLIPSVEACKQNKEFEINGTNVPEIIWEYIKPVEANQQDEFVIFGYNTPFYSAENETIKCKDMCKEIEWLYNGNFEKIHLNPTFGVMHCCRPEDIASQLEIFPIDEMKQKASTTEIPILIKKLSSEEYDGDYEAMLLG